MSAFEELGILPELISAVQDMGWTYAPTELSCMHAPACLLHGTINTTTRTCNHDVAKASCLFRTLLQGNCPDWHADRQTRCSTAIHRH